MLKRLLSIVLSTIIIASAFTILQIDVNAVVAAEPTDSINTSASAEVEPATVTAEPETVVETVPATEQPSGTILTTETPTRSSNNDSDMVEISSKPEIASTGTNGETYEQAARYVPNYVITDNDTIQPMYNPYTVQMLLDLSLDAYHTSVDDSDGWQRTLNAEGYTTKMSLVGNKSYVIGETGDGENSVYQEYYVNPFHAIIGIKKVTYNNHEKYAFVIAFRGSNSISDWVDTNFSIIPTAEGFHSGFKWMADDFLFGFKNIQFTLDGKTMYGAEILNEMKNENSKYCMLVTGHSLGGAVTDVFVGYDLYDWGVHPSNVLAYTFAAPKSAYGYNSYRYKNIINIINEDDVVPTVGATDHIGTVIRYTPDDTFREANYGDKYQEGHGTSWWNSLANELPHFVSHGLREVYQPIINDIKDNIGDYTDYHTNGDNTWNSVTINKNCYLFINGNLSVDGELELEHCSFEIEDSVTARSINIKNSTLTATSVTQNGLSSDYYFSLENGVIKADKSGSSYYSTLNIHGNNYVEGDLGTRSVQFFEGGRLEVTGDFSYNYMQMVYDDNYLLVYGTFTPRGGSAYNSSPKLSKGVVELKGDFVQEGQGDVYYSSGKEHKTIFSGDSTQSITMKSPNSNSINNVEFKNQNIEFLSSVCSLKIDQNLCLHNSNALIIEGELTIENCSFEIEDSVTARSINIKNSTLTATSVTQNGLSSDYCFSLENGVIKADKTSSSYYSTLNIHGNNYVEGDLGTRSVQFFEGGRLEVTGDFSYNYMQMVYDDNYLLVYGTFTPRGGSAYNSSPKLSKGVVELKGDFVQEGQGDVYYSSGKEHKTIFSGDSIQTVSITSANSNTFGTVIITNHSNEGVIFNNDISVNKLFDHKGNNFTLYNDGIGSSFVDYDGDGMLDHVDPYPTNPNNLPPIEEPTQQSSETPLLLGDVDGDGVVTILDATVIQRHLASIPTFSYIEAAADSDEDGSISILDATMIQRWLANLQSNDNIGKPIK